MGDSYMREQAEALAQHLRLTDGKTGYVEATADGFQVFLRRKWPGKPLTSWDGLPVEWIENLGTHMTRGR